MLFTCLFLLPHTNYALNYTCLVDKFDFQNGAAHAFFHSPRRVTLHTSGYRTIMFWWIGALETIVYDLKSITNFGNLWGFYINDIYLVAEIW